MGEARRGIMLFAVSFRYFFPDVSVTVGTVSI